MEKYIDVETLENILKFVNSEIERVCNDETLSVAYVAYDNVRDRLRGALLSARSDVAPVRRARWVSDGWKYSEFHCCSACGCLSFRVEDNFGYELSEILSNFCPDCGARMEGEA